MEATSVILPQKLGLKLRKKAEGSHGKFIMIYIHAKSEILSSKEIRL